MKKIASMALIGAVGIFCLAMSGCGCDHQWVDASCSEAKYCAECEEIEGEPLGHEWVAATETEPKTCIRCGETDGDPLRVELNYSLSNAYEALESCFGFIPDCSLHLEQESSNSYAIYNGSNLIGILGDNIEDFDVVALVDPDKNGAEKHLEQMMYALIMCNDSSITQSEASGIIDELVEEDNAQIIGGAFYSLGMQGGMYAFGVQSLY